MTNNQIQTRAAAAPISLASFGYSPEALAVIKAQIAPGIDDGNLAYFLQVCQARGLDPFSRQICIVARNSYNEASGRWEAKWTIQVEIDGLRAKAIGTGEHAGTDGPYWCGEDGVWTDVWLDQKKPPAAAKFYVYRRGSPRPFAGVATYKEFCQTKKGGVPVKMWGMESGMPATMLAKCAEAQALRRAFASELSGLTAVGERPDDGSAEIDDSQAVTDAMVAERRVLSDSRPRTPWVEEAVDAEPRAAPKAAPPTREAAATPAPPMSPEASTAFPGAPEVQDAEEVTEDTPENPATDFDAFAAECAGLDLSEMPNRVLAWIKARPVGDRETLYEIFYTAWTAKSAAAIESAETEMAAIYAFQDAVRINLTPAAVKDLRDYTLARVALLGGPVQEAISRAEAAASAAELRELVAGQRGILKNGQWSFFYQRYAECLAKVQAAEPKAKGKR